MAAQKGYDSCGATERVIAFSDTEHVAIMTLLARGCRTGQRRKMHPSRQAWRILNCTLLVVTWAGVLACSNEYYGGSSSSDAGVSAAEPVGGSEEEGAVVCAGVLCGDGNPCTFDDCVFDECVSTPLTGQICDDGKDVRRGQPGEICVSILISNH